MSRCLTTYSLGLWIAASLCPARVWAAPTTAPAAAQVPAPDSLAAQVIVSGRTSTARRIDVFDAGQTIPLTFSARVRNTPGFAWYVSLHFALKSDYPPDKAHFYLRLLELAWPHYVELFGAQPAGMDRKRLAVVYASSQAQLKKALASDGIIWDFDGGGITFEGVFASYAYPSGSLQYHQRYILLHECAHLFQMCLAGQTMDTPPWFYEGLADSLGSHVYDTASTRLTVHVLDKPSTADFYDMGLRDLARLPRTFEALAEAGQAGRGVQFLMVHFLRDDVDRLQKFRLWRDEVLALPPAVDRRTFALRRLADILGGWDKANADFAAWLRARHNTFHYAAWGWEQEGNTLWSYGFAPGGRLSRTDVYLPPRDRPAYDSLRMDYPAQNVPAIAGEVRRGVAQPSIAAVLDFSRNPAQGQAGIGLGLIDAPDGGPLDGKVFVDKEGKQPGLVVTAWRLQGFAVSATMKSEDFLAGRKLASGVVPRIVLDTPGSPLAGLDSQFIAQWEGFVRIDAPGEHTFALTSDDGSWLSVDGREVINNGGMHAARVAEGKIRLDKGLHPLRLRYVQGSGPMVLDLTMTPPGQAGYLQVLLDAERRLVIDAGDLGGGKPFTVDLPPDFRAAFPAAAHRIGLNVRITPATLQVTLRTQSPREASRGLCEFSTSFPITPALRDRLLSCPLTLLARGGQHGVTPFFDDARRLEPDLSIPAPPNRWRNCGDGQLFALYKAARRLGDHAPALLGELRDMMLQAAPQDGPSQEKALATLRQKAADLRKAISACPAKPDRIRQTLDDLSQAGL